VRSGTNDLRFALIAILIAPRLRSQAVARHSLAVNILRLSLAMPRRATLGSQSIPTTVLLLLTPALDQKYGVVDCVKVVLDLVAQSMNRDIQDSGRYKQLIAR
jgi:hypothetical protein